MDIYNIFKNPDREESYNKLLEKGEGKKLFFNKEMNAWIIFGYNECRHMLESSTTLSKRRVEIPLNILGESKKNQVSTFIDILNSSMIFGSDINKSGKDLWKHYLMKNIPFENDKKISHVSSNLIYLKEFNIAATITYPYNEYSISRLFKLSEDESRKLLPCARKFAWLLDGKVDSKEVFEKTVDATLLLHDFFKENASRWRNDFPDYKNELVSDLLLVYSAAQDTTAHLLNKCLYEMARNPCLMSDLKLEKIKIKNIIMECIRLLSPITAIGRICKDDVNIGDQRIKKGERLLLYIGYANYDNEIFDDPFNFNLINMKSSPLSFGHGEGKCIGTHVALILSEQLLCWLFERITKIKVLQTKYVSGTSAIGIDELICVVE